MVWVAVFFVLTLPRVLLAIGWPGGGGDTTVYTLVAENLLRNGCVSLSPPALGACTPHWGGNQLPGYPGFLAAVWSVAHSPLAALIVQSVLAAAAPTWLGYCAERPCGRRTAIILAFVTGLSPLTLAWSRMLLTDALSVAAGLWVVAEVLRFLHDGRVRALSLGAALSAAVFLRYDNALLLVPIALILWRQKAALAFVLALAVAPVAVWWGRSVEAGLGWLPPVGAMPDGGKAPTGYIQWGNGWMTDQYEYPAWFYPVAGRRYSQIVLLPQSLERDAEQVRALVRIMATHDGKDLPAEIDEAFASIAQPQWPLVPRRVWNMWFTPFYSSGWPVSLNPQPGASPLQLASENPGSAAVKVGTGVYRLLLIPAAAALAFVVAGWQRRLLIAALAYAAVQSVLHALGGFIDTRYTMSAASFLEAAMVIAAVGRAAPAASNCPPFGRGGRSYDRPGGGAKRASLDDHRGSQLPGIR